MLGAVAGRKWTLDDFHGGQATPTFFETFEVQKAQPKGMRVRQVTGSYDPNRPLDADTTLLCPATSADPLFWLPEGARDVRIGEVESVTVPGGTFECTVVEFEVPRLRKVKAWASNAYPGLLVRQERKSLTDGLEVRSELAAFTEPKPKIVRSTAPSPAGTPGLVLAGFLLVFLCAPIGLVLCVVGYPEAKRRGKGKGLAIAGMVLGGLLFAFTLAQLVIGVIAGPTPGLAPDSGLSSPGSTRPPPEAPAPAP